ncbi:MAG: hypothetical protein R3B07_05905 [Polyangiaceae bacterium]
MRICLPYVLRAHVVVSSLALFACSREPAAQQAAAAAASAPAPSASAVASSGSVTQPVDSAGSAEPPIASGLCHPTDPKLAKFWKELSKEDVDDLLEQHIAGATKSRAGCSLGAFMSTSNIVSFEAAKPPKLLPMQVRWKGGDQGKKPPPLVPNLAGVLPQMDTATPLLEEEFQDGEGNFFTRRLYRATDGSYFLLLDYAG